MRAWMNGTLLTAPSTPAVSVLDHGLMVGDGVFETMQVLHGRPFAVTRHLARLTRSAVGLGLAAPDVEAVRAGIEATIEGQDLPFGRIRITVTSGPGPLGSPRGEGDQAIVVITEPCERPPTTTKLVTVPWVRNERGAVAGLKTTSYAENALMVQYAQQRGASESIMANSVGDLCEGTGSNIFYAVGGELFTPTLASGCLAGITRELVLEWCAPELPVHEKDAPLAVLQEADEVFVVSSIRDVQGVHRIDERDLAAPGPLTRRAAEIFARQSVQDLDP